MFVLERRDGLIGLSFFFSGKEYSYQNELCGTSTNIAQFAAQFDGCTCHGSTKFSIYGRRGCFLFGFSILGLKQMTKRMKCGENLHTSTTF